MENRDKEAQANSGMPLLSLPKDKDLLGPSDAAFGRLLSPNLIIAHEQGFYKNFLSLVLCVCFVDRCLSFCTFPFCHYVVCSSSIYRF
jgi:hypothetical protein